MKTLKSVDTQITHLVWYAAKHKVYNTVYGSVNSNVFYERRGAMSLFETQQAVDIKRVVEECLNK